MRAVIRDRFGIDALAVREIDIPELPDDKVLVRVQAASINPADWYDVVSPPFMRLASRQIRQPKNPRSGTDVSGVIHAVGRDVTEWNVGDEVFGTSPGCFAEFSLAFPNRLARRPPSLNAKDAAGLPIAGLTALQALRDHAKVTRGSSVLINGASGGVGTYTVQVAKSLGATVTAVWSPRNVELVRSLGADRVIDYTAEDFTRLNVRHDAIIDIAGSRSFLACRRVLAPAAPCVVVGARMHNSLLGPLRHIAATYLQSIGRSQKAKFFVAKVEPSDLSHLAELATTGRLQTVIDREFTLAEIQDAFGYLGEGHARGKIIVRVAE